MPARRRLLPLAVLALLAAPNAARSDDEVHLLRCGTGIHSEEAHGFVFAPQGGLFCPLVADPKAIRSFATYLNGEFPKSSGTSNIGSVGIGDGVNLFRFGGPNAGEGLQLSLTAAVFAQFDLDATSDDLLNADYIVGLPITYRRSDFSFRARLYHQSSHLGDELLLRTDTEIERENLSFESIELILSQEFGPFRVYGGGEYLFNRSPGALDPFVVHGGAELRGGSPRGTRLVAALDVKSTEQQDWKPAISARAGVEFALWHSPDHPPRLWSILAEYYEGPSPYGQFFLEDIRYVGGGFHFQL